MTRRPEQPRDIPASSELENLREEFSASEKKFREKDRAREVNTQAQKTTADQIAAVDTEIVTLKSQGTVSPKERVPPDETARQMQREEKARLKAYADELYARHRAAFGNEFSAPGVHVNNLARRGNLSDARREYRAYIENLSRRVNESVPDWVGARAIPEVGTSETLSVDELLKNVAEFDQEIATVKAELKRLRDTYEQDQAELAQLKGELARLKATPALLDYERVLPAPQGPIFEKPTIETPLPPSRPRYTSPVPPLRPAVIELEPTVETIPTPSAETPETELILAARTVEEAEKRAEDFYVQHASELEGHDPQYHPLVSEASLQLKEARSPDERLVAFRRLALAYDDYVEVKTARLVQMEKPPSPAPPPDLPVIEEEVVLETVKPLPATQAELAGVAGGPPPPPGVEIAKAFDEAVGQAESPVPESEKKPPDTTPHPQGGMMHEVEAKPENPKFILKHALKKLKTTLDHMKVQVRERQAGDASFDATEAGIRWTTLRQRAQDFLRDTNVDKPPKTTDRATWYRERTAEIEVARQALETLAYELEHTPPNTLTPNQP